MPSQLADMSDDSDSISEEERSLFRPFTRESLAAIETLIADEYVKQKELEKKRVEGEVRPLPGLPSTSPRDPLLNSPRPPSTSPRDPLHNSPRPPSTSLRDPLHISPGPPPQLPGTPSTSPRDPLHISLGSRPHIPGTPSTSPRDPLHISPGPPPHLPGTPFTSPGDPPPHLSGDPPRLYPCRLTHAPLTSLETLTVVQLRHGGGGQRCHSPPTPHQRPKTADNMSAVALLTNDHQGGGDYTVYHGNNSLNGDWGFGASEPGRPPCNVTVRHFGSQWSLSIDP
ncbi:hypothetical protein PR048_016453 [Dryococelus australis]|uniref:Uncharacterized protein n=1 Tax=Dryococelus australis TaxID=614101 RepID=A0ABQ9HJR0_9NEOP|nr:hypothetical protein PR048_016453 [Dryococelus australis]